jgi:hypothetical protein
VVEAKRLGIGREEMLASVDAHWERLSAGDGAGRKAKVGGDGER